MDDSMLGVSLGGETIVGAGILPGVAGSRWEKAKRNFWASGERIDKGLVP